MVHRLFESVATSVFRPVDILLKTLFAPPQDLVSDMLDSRNAIFNAPAFVDMCETLPGDLVS